MNYIVLAHSPLTGKVFATRIRNCNYKDVRKRFLEIYGSGHDILSITEVPEWY